MTKIVFNNNGYVQGMRPELPTHSVLRRNEERKECSYTDQNVNCVSEPVYDYREPAEHFPVKKSNEHRKGYTAQFGNPNPYSDSNSGKRGLSDMIKGIPLWSVSAINCSMGLMTLLIPCLIVSIGTGAMGWQLDLLSLLMNQNTVVGNLTEAQPWKLLVPTLISAVMTGYFLIMREGSYDKAIIPALAGIVSTVLTVMYMTDIENSMHSSLICVEYGTGAFICLGSSLVLVILSIAAAVINMIRNRKMNC